MDVVSAIVGPVVTVLTGHIKQNLGYLSSYTEHVERMKNRMQFLEDQSADIERLKRQHPNMPAHVPRWLEEVKKIKEDVDNIPSNNIGCLSVKKKFLAGRNALKLTKVIDGLIGDGSKMISDDTLWREAEGYSYADRVKEMKDKMKVLEGHRVDNENHLRRNRENNLEIPDRVDGWLKDAKKIKEDVENDGCFDLEKKMRRNSENNREIPDRVPESLEEVEEEVEKITEDADNITTNNDALKHIKDIDRLIKESSDIIWSDAPIGFGRVDSKRLASTSGGGTQNLFKSRDKTFNDALKLLQQNDDDAARVIALCGMGGVGKTTLMNDLKKVATDKKMFNWISVAVIGNAPNLLAIQKNIALQTGKPLTETDETLMATYLSKRFEEFSERKEKILVILDDVWKKIKLEDIGLASPLPKGVKLLLTSRDANICRQIAVDVGSVLQAVRVDVLEEGEARDFFCQKSNISPDHDLYKIGCEIVKRCGGLPLAIKLIAATLNSQNEFVWRRTLKCLENNDLDEQVHEIIEISYNNLKQEDKAIFRLCGLFPEDSNIPIEDLTRYAWGLKLLNKVYTMKDARDSTQTSVSNLKNAYLLMDGDSLHSDCVKLHDLVLAFVVATVSKGGEECWIIHHKDDFSNWSEANSMSQSCEQISLACKGMSEFLIDFKFPNVTLLKLMQGDESLRFPQDFYEGMEKLQVIAFERMKYPLVPTSAEFSTNLRTLCLDECSLMFDLACIGNLSNLEVLSFANSGITILPSTFGNLKKLRLLDVTGCYYNLVIDDGVFKNLVKLEELYMIPYDEKACCFTDNNSREFAERSENLKRFKLSVGCSFTEVRECMPTYKVDMQSYENSLKLVTNIEELLKSKINELFKITDALYLQVNDMNTLPCSSFYSLRLLVVSECAELKYLFTPSVATTLSKLEYLEISNCDAMEAVIHTEKNGSDIIMFSKLKYLRLARLRKLSCFCNNISVIELPCLMELQLVGLPKITSIYTDSAKSFVSSNISPTQSFLNKEDATRKLEKLFVKDCDSIEVLFNMDFGEIEQLSSSLRSIEVDGCNSLVKLFSCNPFPFFNNLQELEVRRCRSIQVLFEIDSGPAGRYEEQDAAPKLEKLVVYDMEKLKEIWPPQFSISNLCPLRELTVVYCDSIEVLFNMDFGEIEQLSGSLRSITVKRCDGLVKLFSCNPFPFLNNLQELKVKSCGSIQVLFDTDLRRAGKSEEQVCSSSLRSIKVSKCDSLVNLLPSNPMPLFNHLEEIEVYKCASVEVIFDIDMGCVGEMDKVSSSRLRSIKLERLGKIREVWRIKDAGNNLIHGFEAVESIHIEDCWRFENIITPPTTTFYMRALKQVEIFYCGRKKDQELNVIPTSREEVDDGISKVALPSSLLPTFHHIHELDLRVYKDLEVVFEITTPSSRESPHNTQQPPILPYLEKLWLGGLERMSHVWKCDWNEFLILQKPQSQYSFHNLTTIKMYQCNSIKYLFSPLMATLLINLKKVLISSCDGIEEIVSNRDVEDASIYSHTTTTFFPHLDILELKKLRNFKGIGGGANGISTDMHDQLKLSQASWSLCQYAREISIEDCDSLSSVIPWYAVGQMQKLQVLRIEDCKSMTEVFETQEINKSGTDTGKSLLRLEYITMLELPKLKILKIKGCNLLKHVFTFSTLKSLAELEELKIKDCESMADVFEYITILTLPKLKILKIEGCNLLKHIFTFSTLESLTHLEELVVKDCKAMEVIVMEENGQQTTASDVVVFPHLKSIKLINLSKFVGFFLGKNEFTWPSLEKVVIFECPQITMFTYGQSTSPKLNFMNTSLGKHSVECGLNFRMTTTSHQAQLPSYESTSSGHPTTMELLPWSFDNFIEMDVNYNPSGGQTLFPSDKLLQLQKLETVLFRGRGPTEEIFGSQTDAEIPNLRQVDLKWLDGLKYIWKSKQGTVLKFPNLTRLSIHWCNSLEYAFTCPMVGSLLQLQELNISYCDSMKVIVKGEEEECDAIVNAIVVFPCLKSLKLYFLESLEGFCLGKEAFEFPSLDTLEIDVCYKMTVFTKGDLSAPKLYAISKRDRKYNIHNRLNSLIKNFNKK